MAAPLESSVVRIYSKSGKVIGAGFLVSSKYILTCAHVVTDALSIPRNTQEQPDGVINLDFPLLAVKQMFAAKVIFWQPVNPNQAFEDIAGLELETALPDTAQPAQLVTSEDLWGHPFRVLGFPAGQPNGVSASGVLRGRIANGWVQVEDVKQPGYRLEPGFSGAPVWDEELQGVAGMAVAAEMNRADVKAAFIIPTGILVSAWSDLGKQAIPSCPYRGLFAFREQDAPFFFGRETFTEQLFAAVQRQQLVAVIGSSGSGKSSVVLAGLIPKLREEGSCLIESFRPNKQPFYELAAALISQLEPELGKIDKTIKAKELAESIRQHGFTADVSAILKENPGKRLLLVVDQFEELYTGCTATEQQQFVDALLAAVESASRTITLVLTLRADFYSYVVNYPPFTEALNKYPAQNLSLMQAEEMQAAIELPAQKMGIKLEEGLTERILNDVKQEPGNLPLLEFALTQLWEKQSRGLLTHQAYVEIGGVAKALALHAEAVYARLREEEQKQAQRLFVQLVRPGEGTEDTRRLATLAEVGNWELVTRLADARLVVTGRDEQTVEETVEVVHEALIREWGRLRGWMESDRTFRTWQERLRVTVRQWETTSKDDSALLRGSLLAEAEAWQQKRSAELSEAERDFILLSLALRDREKKERERLRQRITLGLVCGLIVTTASALIAAKQWLLAEAELARRRAEDELNTLKEQIGQVRQISQTEDFLVKNLAVTEDSVWMRIYTSEYEGDANGAEAGLLRYDLKAKRSQQYRAGDSSGLRGNIVTALLSDGKDLWIGVESTKWRGVQHGSRNADDFKFTESLPVTSLIFDLVRDRHQHLWVLTYDGLCKLSANKCQIVQDFQPRCPNLASSPWKPRVSQMVLDPAGSILWIGTQRSIIQWPLEGKAGLASCYLKEGGLKQESASRSKSVKALGFDSKNRLWVATTDGEVSRFSKNTERLKWEPENGHTYTLPTDDIEVFAKLPNGLVLAGTKNAGLFLYHPATDKWSKVPIASLEVQTIYDIYFDSHSHLWFATNKGLFYSDKPIQFMKNDNVSPNTNIP